MTALSEQPCWTCGKQFEARSIECLGATINQRHCEACVDAYEAAEEAKRVQSDTARSNRAEERWQAVCPPGYRTMDEDKLPAPAKKAIAQFDDWEPSTRGVIFIGPSGSGKTRLAFYLLKMAHREGLRVSALGPAAFRMGYVAAAMDGRGEGWIQDQVDVDYLLLDDLGQMRLTEASEEALWAVIEGRSSYRRPTIFTTQYKGQELVAQFIRENRGISVQRRLRDFNDVISLVEPKK